MAAPDIHVNDAVIFRFDAKDQDGAVISLVGTTALQVIFTDPCGARKVFAAAITNAPGTDGLYEYKTISNADPTLGDLNLDGPWETQGRVEFSVTEENKTDVQKFTVEKNL